MLFLIPLTLFAMHDPCFLRVSLDLQQGSFRYTC